MIGRNIGELLANIPPNPRYIHGMWLEEGSLNMVYAPRGTGKTYFALQLAHSIAAGCTFLGWEAAQSKTCYFDGEMGSQNIYRRLRAIVQGGGIDYPVDNLRIIDFDDCGGVMWNLSDPDDQMRYDGVIDKYPVVIIDNLLACSRRMSGRDDDFAQWERIQAWFVRLRSAGKTVILIHHAGKSGEQLGTSTRENIMDTILELRDIRMDNRDKTELQIWFKKARNLERRHTAPVYAFYETLPDGGLRWADEPLADAVIRCVRKLKDVHNIHKTSEIACALDVSETFIIRTLADQKRRETDGKW